MDRARPRVYAGCQGLCTASRHCCGGTGGWPVMCARTPSSAHYTNTPEGHCPVHVMGKASVSTKRHENLHGWHRSCSWARVTLCHVWRAGNTHTLNSCELYWPRCQRWGPEWQMGHGSGHWYQLHTLIHMHTTKRRGQRLQRPRAQSSSRHWTARLLRYDKQNDMTIHWWLCHGPRRWPGSKNRKKNENGIFGISASRGFRQVIVCHVFGGGKNLTKAHAVDQGHPDAHSKSMRGFANSSSVPLSSTMRQACQAPNEDCVPCGWHQTT